MEQDVSECHVWKEMFTFLVICDSNQHVFEKVIAYCIDKPWSPNLGDWGSSIVKQLGLGLGMELGIGLGMGIEGPSPRR